MRWLDGTAGSEAIAGSLKGRTRVQVILGLVPAHWWVELGPRVSGWRSWIWCLHTGMQGQTLCPLVGRAMSRGCCVSGGS